MYIVHSMRHTYTQTIDPTKHYGIVHDRRIIVDARARERESGKKVASDVINFLAKTRSTSSNRHQSFGPALYAVSHRVKCKIQ